MTFRSDSSRPRYDNFINATAVAPATGNYFETINPTTGDAWAEIAKGSRDDVNQAVAAAKVALPGWSATKPSERGRRLMALADVIERHADRLAEIEVRDNGKLYAEMRAQMAYLSSWYRYYGGLADKVEGRVIATDKDNIFNFTLNEPVGIIAMITPWNSPLLLLTWKLAPALAAGNVAVIKPSEHTSASTIEFLGLFEEAAFPAGVVNAVLGMGEEVGVPLVSHPDVAMVAFTGSDGVGQKIYETAARDIKHVTLELGGKSPNIVFDDADLEAAVVGAISGIFAASGQTCIAGSRLLLHRPIHDAFLEKFLKLVAAAKVGDPMKASTNLGPIATRPQMEKVMSYIDVAKAEGATCLFGGARAEGPEITSDLFVLPTIFGGVSNNMRIAREEVFGPVLSVILFDDEEEAYSIANDTDFGLGAGLWTRDMRRALEGSARVKAGTVWVNTYRALSYTSPFGGYKRSGIGREGGVEAIKEFLNTKSVWICTDPSVDNPFVMR